ncbi:extracellular solute-binding protein family 1 [Denitrovibrio acetiphilus DSM 12809]|uniref:Extracellular solute-binding protein family 1 n=1 Tax=Denitrovibrio acetiphilus (strain DSM 12809 / NBRC 114555 / N2460) TaxID=522772 RepID=D4H7E0_DENA2|nr:substrate-binding domain-containing protein [Denitrovibrio acetiphilus]ADD67939.1 extracellular solute-binding protein family 1 [Denitrovibrio acetiphilus DSM 12809]
MHKLLILCVLQCILFACDPYENPLTRNKPLNEILVYTGITMSDAVLELKSEFEKENDCLVHVMYGASGYLKRVIDVNKKGDIFIPGNSSFLDTLIGDAVVTRRETLGYNRLSFFVPKGNPMGLNGSLSQLAEGDLRLIIGAPESGSVGKETMYLLQKYGIFHDVALQVHSFAADSKKLASAIRDNDADIAINWRAVGYTLKNRDFMDAIDIDSPYIRKVPVVMGLLKYSVDTGCPVKFMNMAVSEKGRQIFHKYGFRD